MRVRTAGQSDASGVSEILQDLVAAGKRKKRSDLEFATTHYIEHPNQIRCSIIEDEVAGMIGFQSLKIATNPNPYETPVGYGIIGTHIRPDFARCGAGSLLFASTYEAARTNRLPAIEACIAVENSAGIAFYQAMGFVTYRHFERAVCKRIWVK